MVKKRSLKSSAKSSKKTVKSPAPKRFSKPIEREVTFWLFCIAISIVIMAVIGAVTRLTESGLSIVEWKPILGVIPPLSAAEWEKAFDQYKQIAEFKIQHSWMSLEDFKSIYWWEYVHRLWGRFIGLLFLIPFVVFWIKGALTPSLKKHGLIILSLGGFQGWIGWWMVHSGVIQNIDDVAPLRLTVHLTLAFILFSYVLLLAFNRVLTPLKQAQQNILIWKILLGLTFLTIIFGALVAGHNAGWLYQSWPLMDGEVMPADVWGLSAWWVNLYDNPAGVQFIHRWLAHVLVIGLVGFSVVELMKRPEKKYKIALIHVIVMTLIQLSLGIHVLILGMPLSIAALHQVGALALLACVLWAVSLGRKST